MTLIAKTLPLDWLRPLVTGDDSTLDPPGRRILAAFRSDLVRCHGDWHLAHAHARGWTPSHAGYRFGLGACWCCHAVFVAMPPPRPTGRPSPALVATAARRR